MRDHLLKCFNGHGLTFVDPVQRRRQAKEFLDQTMKNLVAASVLIPIIDRPTGLTVLFTQRSKKLKNHPGQISFPGGRAEKNDKDVIATALRESQEEIGLRPERVNVLGRLGLCLTGTGFEVTPIVGLIEEPLALSLATNEVTETFEIPLLLLLDENRYRTNTAVLPSGLKREFYIFDYPQRYIWGATAQMLVDLRKLLES
jgi:8-oxo-dGTP pyrophosphatase MutT (NUDIX family)